jgi:hypothetical protein
MIQPNVEDALNQLEENSAIIQSALYDPDCSSPSLTGLQRLMQENMNTVHKLRRTLPATVMFLLLFDEDTAA